MTDRRDVLKALALGAAGALLPGCARLGAVPEAGGPRLAFSTLGTPDWPWARVLGTARDLGYAALELRTVEGTEDLPSLPRFAPDRIAATRRQIAAHGLRVVCVDSSAAFHDPDTFEVQVSEAKGTVELAARLGAPYVRVFGDRFPEGEDRAAVLRRVANALRIVGVHASGIGVRVLLETHGDFVRSPTLVELIERVGSSSVGILWDAHHTFVFGEEEPAETVRQLGPYIYHTHLKDSVPAPGGDPEARRYVLTGTGEVPVDAQVEALLAAGYDGDLSFEWEKRWHPEIEDPEVALPHFVRTVRGYVGSATSGA